MVNTSDGPPVAADGTDGAVSEYCMMVRGPLYSRRTIDCVIRLNNHSIRHSFIILPKIACPIIKGYDLLNSLNISLVLLGINQRNLKRSKQLRIDRHDLEAPHD